MKLVLRILKVFAILIISVSIILYSASILLQDKVASVLLKSINENISTKLDIGSFKLSFLRKFPKASLELKDVLVHSVSDFNSVSFSGINTDTLFEARDASVEFKITDIINGIYKIERISVRTGKLNLYIDTAGLVNYNIYIKNSGSSGNDFSIDLERIYLTNLKVYYNNLATKLITKGLVKNGKLKSMISGDNIEFTAQADLQINSFQLFNTKIAKPVSAELEITLQDNKSSILIKKGAMKVDSYDFGLSGLISSKNMLDLNISGHNIDIAKIRNYLPEKYFRLVSEYNPSGVLVIESKIKGLLTRTSNPNIEISFFLKNGHIAYGKSDLSVNNLSFTGDFSNGTKNCPKTSSLTIKDIKAKIGSAEYNGDFKLNNFEHPAINLTLRGKVIPGELKEFFNLKDISTAKGYVDLNLNIAGIYDPKKKYSLTDIAEMKPEAVLDFSSFSLGFKKDKYLVTQVNGNVTVSNSIWANNLQLTYKEQKIKINGEFKNLPEWLTGKPVQLIASADVFFDRFIPEVFIPDFSSSDTISHKKPIFTMPDDLILDINFKIDSLNYKTYSSSAISGTLKYKPRLLTFKSFDMQSLAGFISGNGFIVQGANKAFVAKGNINVNDINVKNAFTSFHNFGQDFIKADNLNGNLSGSFSAIIPMDSMLNPQIKSITAEGKYILSKGSLINFDPIKQLSSFIELSELQNISFETLVNDFFIRNNYLYTPQMDVKSSAADLTVNGKHSFDNDYEYHVKMLLSEILSKKRKKNKSPVTEFGIVEDDGLGRTSLLLKIVGKGENIKVGYDIKAASNQVKSNIKAERQTLKTILNQEYGWFKNDSVPKQKPAEKKSRFRISWGETDSAKSTPDVPVVKKENTMKNLFKKK
jgi:hypothetical protein